MPDTISRINAALEGRYVIEREIGEGGMATVYLADDLRHERKVALKVLKPELAAVVGAERFLAEIKTTATLHHPHILPLFDSGEAGGFLYFVMPFIEGETLRERIDREKQLPIDEAVQITTAVAQAMQHAHDRGVIHRDIKPGNILIQDGQPVVADFGIALAVGAAGGNRLTETGLSVGTPYYMSPEQATGDQEVGPRSDVYALAAVLYEMLTGDPPYGGSTAQAVLGQIIAGETVSAIKKRRSIPAHVDAAIRNALEKLPADRFADAQSFAKALADPSFRYGVGAAAKGASATVWSRMTAAMTGLAALFAIGLVWALLRPAPSAPVARHILSTEGWAGINGGVGRLAALAPDGSSMILPLAGGGLGVKMRSSDEITPIADTEGTLDVVYGPDSQWILYATPGELRRRPLVGGSSVTLATDLETGNRVALDWLDDGTILYERTGPDFRRIVHITDNGEVLDVVWPPEGEQYAPVWLRGLPGSKGFLLLACEGIDIACEGSRSQLWAIDIASHSASVVLEQVVAAWYVDLGYIVYVAADGSVFARSFDVGRLEITGGANPLFEGVRLGSNVGEMRLGKDGTVLYVAGGGNVMLQREAAWVDRAGRAESVAEDLSSANLVTPALSPDGRRLAVSVGDGGGAANIYVKELPDGAFTRVTTDAGASNAPVWSPDGTRILYRATDGGVAHVRGVRSDGSSAGSFDVVLQHDVPLGSRLALTPDLGGLVFTEPRADGTGGQDIKLLDLATDSVSELLATDFNERGATVSPDGRWLAYVSDEAGTLQVFVRLLSSPDSLRTQVSRSEGQEPVWAHNGRELFYREQSSMWVATYSAGASFEVSSRQRLFDDNAYLTSTDIAQYDVTPDDERFVMISTVPLARETSSPGEEPRLILIENWFEELKQLLAD